MIIAILVYITIGSIYTAHRFEGVVNELNKDEYFKFNTENRAVLNIIFFVCVITYPVDFFERLINKFK